MHLVSRACGLGVVLSLRGGAGHSGRGRHYVVHAAPCRPLGFVHGGSARVSNSSTCAGSGGWAVPRCSHPVSPVHHRCRAAQRACQNLRRRSRNCWSSCGLCLPRIRMVNCRPQPRQRRLHAPHAPGAGLPGAARCRPCGARADRSRPETVQVHEQDDHASVASPPARPGCPRPRAPHHEGTAVQQPRERIVLRQMQQSVCSGDALGDVPRSGT